MVSGQPGGLPLHSSSCTNYCYWAPPGFGIRILSMSVPASRAVCFLDFLNGTLLGTGEHLGTKLLTLFAPCGDNVIEIDLKRAIMPWRAPRLASFFNNTMLLRWRIYRRRLPLHLETSPDNSIDPSNPGTPRRHELHEPPPRRSLRPRSGL